MSASDHLGQQFEAYRAVLGAAKVTQPLGSYWSADHNEPYAYYHSGTYGEKPPAGPHHIITATYNPEDEEGGWSDANKPVNLKKGSKVKVSEITKVTMKPEEERAMNRGREKRFRTRRFNPPREMEV